MQTLTRLGSLEEEKEEELMGCEREGKKRKKAAPLPPLCLQTGFLLSLPSSPSLAWPVWGGVIKEARPLKKWVWLYGVRPWQIDYWL